jgi:hypothetical protein
MIDYKRKHKLIPSDCFDDREKLKAWIANHFNVPKCGNWFADALIAIAHGRSVSLSGRRHSKSMLSKFAAGFEIIPKDDVMRVPITLSFDGGCVHDLKIYDSGWTKEEFCTKCTHKRKL